MTPHINAAKGDYAETVLLPGDPLRAKWIAETFLSDVRQVNTVRNMLGFTGTYKGRAISVQGTGMGMPSASIYMYELMDVYGVKNLIRVGTCGAIHADVPVRRVILGQTASTDNGVNRRRFDGMDYAAGADFGLLHQAFHIGQSREMDVVVGGIFSADEFYSDAGLDHYAKMAAHGVLAVEMEANALYTLATKFEARALAICSVSDNIVTGEQIDATDRQQSLTDMVELALETVLTI